MSINKAKDTDIYFGKTSEYTQTNNFETCICENGHIKVKCKKGVRRLNVSVKNKKTKENEISSLSDRYYEHENDIQYHIFDYFKEHPSLFVTAASALVAMISVFLKLTAFLGANSYLMYFNVDNTIYKQSTQFIYFITIALALLIVIILFQGFSVKTFESYLPYKKKYLLQKYSLRNIRDRQKIRKKELKKLEKRLSRVAKAIPNDDEIKRTENDLSLLKEENKEIKNKYKSIARSIRKCRLLLFVLIGISCLLAGIVIFVISLLMFSIDMYDWKKTILFSIIVSAVYVSVNFVENWFLICVIQIKRKEIKADSQLEIKEIDLKYSNFSKFPINSLINGDFKSLLNDSNCKKFVFSVAFCIIILLFASAWSGSKTASNQQDFFIVNKDNQIYAVIYNNGENSVLEKIEIENDSILIDTMHQKIISSKDIDMKKYTFNKVDIVRDSGSFDNDATTESVNDDK